MRNQDIYSFCYTQATAVRLAYPRANEIDKGKKFNKTGKRSSGTLANYHPMMVLATNMVL